MAAGNPNLTLGEGSGCGAAVGHHQSAFSVRARALLKELDPNCDPKEMTKEFSGKLKEMIICETLQLFAIEDDLCERLKNLQEEHDALKNSYQELLRNNEADKQKDKGLGDSYK